MFKKLIGLSLCFGLLATIGGVFAEKDIMEIMFEPAKSYEKIVDLGADKNQVGNEIFRESTQFGINDNAGKGCFVNNQHISESEIQGQMNSVGYKGTPSSFCQDILGGDQDISVMGSQSQAPLIVRITKFLLRITMVLAITMVLYNGILWIIESAKGGDVKDAKNNIIYVIGGILVALSSVALINLVSSISTSTLSSSASNGSCITTEGFNYSFGSTELKRYLCEHEKGYNGKWYNDSVGRSCRADYKSKGYDDGYWVLITENNQKEKCGAAGGTLSN